VAKLGITGKNQSIVSAKDFGMILRIIKANWWIPLIIVPIFYLIATFYVYRLTTIYKASTEFLIKSDDAYYKGNVLSAETFLGSSYMDNSNETRIIQSYDLTSRVVQKLLSKIQVSYFIVGKVRTTEQFVGMPFSVEIISLNPSFYERTFDFHVINSNEYQIDFELDGRKETKRGRFGKDLVDLDLKIRISWVSDYGAKATEILGDIFYQFVVHSEEHLINEIRNNIKVTNPEYTQILKVELKDVIPDRAILILDTLNAVYAENKLASKFELNDRTVTYIDKQLNEISFSLKSIEDTMQAYKEKASIIDLEWEQKDFLNKISIYDGDRSQLQLQLSALDDLERYIIEDKDPQFLPPNIFVFEKGGFMNKAVQDLYSQQLELNKMGGMARESNPDIQVLKEGIKKIKRDLLVYISNTRKATNQQISSLNQEIAAYVREAKMIPSKQRDVLNIQRKASVSEELYSFLLEKKASTKIARASIVPDVKIIEAPRFDGIDSPDKSKLEKQVVSFGFVLSIILVVLRTMFYTTIKSVEHLKDLTDLPLIGVLPREKGGDTEGIIVDSSPNSFISEAFRNFRTNLQYANVDTEAKTFLITSFLPGEGKTFTSVNLAAMLAKSGKRTVVIELDLHKPRIYKRFGFPIQTKGLTTCVNGESTFEEIVTATRVENLFCIFSGPIPPNPSDYVLSIKMKEIINRAKQEFDYVIIDSPPAGLLSDSVYLIQYVDSSVFVLNTKTSSKKVITFVEELIASNNLKNVLLLLNGVERPKRKYYYSGYGYSYGYGYGYGFGKGQNYRK
jgi:capsular exopolysaccharide synthesis family protein